jgi:hypothetical protein
LDEEAERLESEIDELAKQLAEISPDNPAYDTLLSKGKQLDTQLSGVEWGREEWDVDQITLSGLTGGEFGRVEDELSDAAASRQRRGGQPGARRVYIVAYGTDDAPYIDAGMDDDEKIAAAANLPVAYLKWAEAQINDLSTVGNENGRQSFTQLVAEKRQEQAQNSTESTSSD